ncbi:MAG: hypothetical protein AB7V62_03695 [Thermoleophilia bacterium]
MLRSPIIARFAQRVARRRLRRMGGTGTTAWALRVPLVTLVLSAAFLMVLRRAGSPRR